MAEVWGNPPISTRSTRKQHLSRDARLTGHITLCPHMPSSGRDYALLKKESILQIWYHFQHLLAGLLRATWIMQICDLAAAPGMLETYPAAAGSPTCHGAAPHCPGGVGAGTVHRYNQTPLGHQPDGEWPWKFRCGCGCRHRWYFCVLSTTEQNH